MLLNKNKLNRQLGSSNIPHDRDLAELMGFMNSIIFFVYIIYNIFNILHP